MKMPTTYLFWMVAAAIFQLPTSTKAQQQYFANAFNERAVPCPDDPNQIGYKHVIDINVDQRTELERVANGEPARKPYVIPFCNRFKFLMEQEILEVLLDEVTFVCGYNGTNAELCVLEGGNVQVKIAPNMQTDVIFQGMSFYAFTGVSVEAYGASTSKITFNDVKWKNFVAGSTAVHQMNPSGGTPMVVEINTGAFETGVGGNMIDNVGGPLSFTGLTVEEGTIADSIIRTSAGGTSTVSNVNVELSDLVRLTHTLEGGSLTINTISISQMNSLGTVLYVEGSGSSLTANNLVVKDIALLEKYTAQLSRNFNVVIATDGSRASVTRVTMTNCDGVDRVFSASAAAQMSVTDANITDCTGTSPPDLLSNIAMSEDGGSMSVLRLQTTNIEAFSSVYFATCGSTIQVVQSCAFGGTVSSPGFVSADSTFTTNANFMDVVELGSTTCRNAQDGAVIYKESGLDSECFSATGTGSCSGTCIVGFAESNTTCLAGNPNAGFSLAAAPAVSGGGANNPSCPASPPTPVPTLPPVPASTGASGSGSEMPVFTATIPPGQPGGGQPAGGGSAGGPGSTPETGGSSSGGSSGGSNGGDGGSGGSSGTSTINLRQMSQTAVQVGSALLMAKLVHRMLF